MPGPETNRMKTSKTIAGLIGPTLVAIAASMVLNIGSFHELAEQLSRDPALFFVSGILLSRLPPDLARTSARLVLEPSSSWGSAPFSRSWHIDVIDYALASQRAL